MIKNSFCVIFLMAISMGSCNRESTSSADKNTCTVTKPIEELLWLKHKVQDLEKNRADRTYPYFYILQGSLDDETVFIFDNCCPMCTTVIPVYSCDGELLFHTNEDLEKAKRITNKKIIWKPDGFSCTIE